jgi:hypothetical protein
LEARVLAAQGTLGVLVGKEEQAPRMKRTWRVACCCVPWRGVAYCNTLVLRGAAWCCVVLYGVAWCCVVYRGPRLQPFQSISPLSPWTDGPLVVAVVVVVVVLVVVGVFLQQQHRQLLQAALQEPRWIETCAVAAGMVIVG